MVGKAVGAAVTAEKGVMVGKAVAVGSAARRGVENKVSIRGTTKISRKITPPTAKASAVNKTPLAVRLNIVSLLSRYWATPIQPR
jgi:hypothetical protein